MPDPFTLLAGTANRPLAEAIARELGCQLARLRDERFPDGEVHVRLEESVRGREVFLIQPTSPPVNDHLVELLAMADACRRASAERITAILPYFGYARADKREGSREPVMARVAADLMQTVGIGHVVAVDLHVPQLEGFFRIPVDNLTAIPLLADAAHHLLDGETVLVAPDAGRVKMATRYAEYLHIPLIVLHKRRTSGQETAVTHIVGDVRGRICLIVDDMVSTGGTIAESARVLREAGARDDVWVAATHGLFLDDALARMRSAGVAGVITTDSVRRGDAGGAGDAGGGMVTVVSVAPMLATAIGRFVADGSLGGLR